MNYQGAGVPTDPDPVSDWRSRYESELVPVVTTALLGSGLASTLVDLRDPLVQILDGFI